MEAWILEGWKLIAGFIAAVLLQEVRWRRREKASLNERRVQAYERFLAVSDLCYAAAREQADLQRGLNRWNGSSRVAVVKATKLDERLPKVQEEVAAALAAVRIHGTAEAVTVAEKMFAAVAAPLLRQEGDPNLQFVELTSSKGAFLDVVRRESGADQLAPAS